MGRLIGNVDTYKDESARVPQVYIQKAYATGSAVTATYANTCDLSTYVANLGTIRNKLEAKHEYWVEMNFQTNGLIDYIVISYDLDTTTGMGCETAASHTRTNTGS